MIFQNQLACIVDGVPYRGKLDEHIAAVGILVHHPLNLIQMAGSPGQAVDHGLLLLRTVDMAMMAGMAASRIRRAPAMIGMTMVMT